MFTIDANVYLLRGLHDGDWVGLLVCADRGRVQAQDTHPALSHQQRNRTSTNAQAQIRKHKPEYASTHLASPISPTALPLSKFRLVPHAQHHFGLCKSIQTSSAPIMTKFENSALSSKKHWSLYFLIYEYLIAPHVWWLLETANEFRFWWPRGVRPHWPRSLAVIQLLSLGSWRMARRPLVGSGLLQLLPSAGALHHLTLHSHYTGRNFGPNQFCLSPSLINLAVILGPLILSPRPL